MAVEDQVKRPPWEPRHEWESRVQFVEDNSDRYGLEKAINLSKVWGNMKFMECSYPQEVESMVSYYPVPDLETLRARRKRKESDRGTSNEPNRDRDTDDLPDAKKARNEVDSTDFRDEFEREWSTKIASQVDALIASVRKQSQEEKNPTQPSLPPILKSISDKICLCDSCLGQFGPPPLAIQKVNRILDRYIANCDGKLTYEFIGDFATLPDGNHGNKCALEINGLVVTERTVAGKRKDAKHQVAEDVLQMVEGYQEYHGKPPCLKGGGSSTQRGVDGSSSGIKSSFFSSAVQKASGGGRRP